MEKRGIELAYLAGALDGDGSFSLIKRSTRSVSPLYEPMIQIANVNKELIDLFHNYSGSTGIRSSYIAKDGAIRRKCYYWKAKGLKQSLPILESVIPYLVMKKERALFLRNYIVNNPFKRGSNRLSDDELRVREKAYLVMRNFNNNPSSNGNLYTKSKRKTSDNDEFWAYTAAIIDTDGSLSIKKENGVSRGRRSPTYTALISLTMTDCTSIYYIANNFVGCNVTIVKAKSAIKGFCYRFTISSKKVAIEFLKKCTPFLLIKKDQAKILLDFCESSKTTKLRMNGISEEELKFRESCYERIIQLNKYGVVKPSLIEVETLWGDTAEAKAP